MKFLQHFYEIDSLNEESIADIRKGIVSARKKRSKPVKSEILRVGKDGSVRFKSNAITSKTKKFYEQTIKPLRKIPKDVTLAELREFYNNDVKVFCQCPDFKYRFAYRATEDNYKLGNKETRESNITNPQGDGFPEGTACKHLNNALSVLKPNLPKILKMFREANKVEK